MSIHVRMQDDRCQPQIAGGEGEADEGRSLCVGRLERTVDAGSIGGLRPLELYSGGQSEGESKMMVRKDQGAREASEGFD